MKHSRYMEKPSTGVMAVDLGGLGECETSVKLSKPAVQVRPLAHNALVDCSEPDGPIPSR